MSVVEGSFTLGAMHDRQRGFTVFGALAEGCLSGMIFLIIQVERPSPSEVPCWQGRISLTSQKN